MSNERGGASRFASSARVSNVGGIGKAEARLSIVTTGSISEWISSLKDGDFAAAQKLWDRYSGQLVLSAKRQLRTVCHRIADEEDVAQSVFALVCRGAEAGRFADVQNRDELWWLLLAISRQKVVDLHRGETALKRGGGKVRTESALQESCGREVKFSLDQLVGDEPTPEVLIAIDEQQQRLLGMLRDDVVRRVAIARIEGYTIPEIAGELAISPRSVERKLQLIRKRWAEDLGSATSSTNV